MSFEDTPRWVPFIAMMASFGLTPWFFLIMFGFPIRNSWLFALSIPLMMVGVFCLTFAGFAFSVMDHQPLEALVTIIFPLGISIGGSYLLSKRNAPPRTNT